MQHPLPKRIEWGAHEHEHREKTSDWFWALGLVALVGFIGALLLGNVLLAIVILLGGLVMGLYATLHPHYAEFTLTHRGVTIENKLYPYQTLDSFWIDDIIPEKPKLLIKSQKILMPLMVLPLPDDIDPEIVHRFLQQYIPEEENNEPIAHRLIEALGF